MKLAVLGATGGVGTEIVRQALARGHSVTALARAPDRLGAFADRIAVLQGDLLDPNELERASGGHDAVLSGFGPRLPLSKADADLLERFAIALTAAMQRTAVRRLVIVSTAFLFQDAVIPPAHLFGRLFFASIVADSAAMEKIVSQSGLEWTIVRPPRLTDKPHTGKYRARDGHLPFAGFSIPRADVADFMLNCAEDRGWIGKVAGVAT
jgi:putative NADH-flavin reductase